jgi:hypothetical protein
MSEVVTGVDHEVWLQLGQRREKVILLGLPGGIVQVGEVQHAYWFFGNTLNREGVKFERT